jgi:hypothetical protein
LGDSMIKKVFASHLSECLVCGVRSCEWILFWFLQTNGGKNSAGCWRKETVVEVEEEFWG